MEMEGIAEMILTLPDFEDETELFESECKECLLILTDCRVILKFNVDGIFEDYTFYIVDIKWIAQSSKIKNIFAIKTNQPKTYSLTCDKVSDIVILIGLLYSRCKGKELKVYKLSVDNFNEYEAKKGCLKRPESKYLIQGKRSKNKSSDKDSQLSKENTVDSEEDKSPSKKNEFNFMDSGIEKGNEIIKKLGDKFIEKQQQEMQLSESTLLFRGRVKDKKVVKLRYGDLLEDKIKNHKGDSFDPDPEPEDEDLTSSSIKKSQSIDEEQKSDNSEDSDDSDKNSKGVSKVKLSDFVLIKLLSKGGFGSVFLGKNTIDGKYYAMKRLRKDLLIETGQIENTLCEKNILLMNDCHLLLGMKYAFQNDFRIYFMLEYINGGSLYQNLQKIGRFKEDETKFFIAQIAVALSYLHKNNVVHRDLKPENVMLRENGYCVLADFGLSKFLNSENDLLKSRVGTDEYSILLYVKLIHTH